MQHFKVLATFKKTTWIVLMQLEYVLASSIRPVPVAVVLGIIPGVRKPVVMVDGIATTAVGSADAWRICGGRRA